MSTSALPPEIIEAILLLLPAKSLGRFKSVSKAWNSLISDPKFIKKHLQNLQTTKLILLSTTTYSLYSLDTNLNINSSGDVDEIPATAVELSFPGKQVMGSCNGLVLTKAKGSKGALFLINPTTKKHRKVPLSPFALPDVAVFVSYRLGYDSSTHDYKVLCISDTISESVDMHVSVYSLRNNSWKRLPNSQYHLRIRGFLPVMINQKLHWFENLSSTIVAFSFTTEEFDAFRLPFLEVFGGMKVWNYSLVDIDGKLGVFLGIGGGGFELWVMGDYGVCNSWTRLCCLEISGHVTPVCLVEGSNRDIILDTNGDVLVFNIDEKRCRNVKIEGGPGGFSVLDTYAESLESPTRILRAP